MNESGWFAAMLLFRSSVDDDQPGGALCEESTIVLRAESPDEALARAREFGAAAEHDYKNEAGATVTWSFVDVLEVQDLSEGTIVEGTEVWSRLYREAATDESADLPSGPDHDPSA